MSVMGMIPLALPRLHFGAAAVAVNPHGRPASKEWLSDSAHTRISCRPSGRARYRAVQHQTERSGKLVCIVPVRRVPLTEFPALRAPGDHGAGLALFPSAHIRNGPTLFCMTRMRVGVIPVPPPCCIGIRGGTLSRCCFAAGSCMGCGSIRC